MPTPLTTKPQDLGSQVKSFKNEDSDLSDHAKNSLDYPKNNILVLNVFQPRPLMAEQLHDPGTRRNDFRADSRARETL